MTSCWVTASISATASGVGGAALRTGSTASAGTAPAAACASSDERLDLAPQLVLVGLAPDPAHLGQGVPLDHAKSPLVGLRRPSSRTDGTTAGGGRVLPAGRLGVVGVTRPRKAPRRQQLTPLQPPTPAELAASVTSPAASGNDFGSPTGVPPRPDAARCADAATESTELVACDDEHMPFRRTRHRSYVHIGRTRWRQDNGPLTCQATAFGPSGQRRLLTNDAFGRTGPERRGGTRPSSKRRRRTDPGHRQPCPCDHLEVGDLSAPTNGLGPECPGRPSST